MATKAQGAVKKTSKALAKPIEVSGQLVITTIPSTLQAFEALEQGIKLWVEQDDVSQTDVLRKKLNATSMDDLSNNDLESPTNHLGEWFTCTGINGVRNSDQPTSVLGIFLVADLVNSDGEQVTMAVGFTDGIVTLLKVRELGGFPVKLNFSQAVGKAKPGQNAPLNLNLERKQKVVNLEGGGTF